ncbi:hypothetical protein Pan258_46180 [Symmachiella dynata]|uniref:hypothetical protein n=1 Tax=Symmachiella dynata TaxID=2527995 RepID=UPI00118B96D5|nr:hypothetical protein [Symmachiella dynata]QDT50539.1 hypothetical protein Pan258_46180 [Symmachiella dynata]
MFDDPADDLLYFNGVNGSTGDYLLEPMPPNQIAAIAKGKPLEKRQMAELQQLCERMTKARYGVVAGVDESKIEESGWGVIFSHDADRRLRDALLPLLDLRKEQATLRENLYREYWGPDGYQLGERKEAFLARHGAGFGPADPHNVPYYLLIIGSPNSIPFRFQYQLDVAYAVGRLWFDGDDAYSKYRQYSESVVAAETGKIALSRKAVFFGVENENDRATQLSAKELVAPLADGLPKWLNRDKPAWDIGKIIGNQATKEKLGRLLGGDETPSLIFTASHGMGFNNGDSKQLRHQGALLCQDWPGPLAWRRPIAVDHYFSGDDIDDNANVFGLIAFQFACYGAGTPKMDDFSHLSLGNPVEIAPHAFLASLPQSLVGHPNGSALAVIGHVERAWGYSFMWNRAGRQLQAFQATLTKTMDGLPIGAALEYFNCRYAELSTALSAVLEDIDLGVNVPDQDVAELWTANNDARSYIIVGDPAVRLPLKSSEESDTLRANLESTRLSPPRPSSVTANEEIV